MAALLNAKVGEKKNSDEGRIVGNAGLGKRNERGIFLVDFAISNQLIIKNTMFQKHPRRLYTWTPPDGKIKNQIDYILTEKRWAITIQDAMTTPKADCDSDHEQLIATMKLKLKYKKTSTKPIRYNVQNINKEYAIKVKNKFRALFRAKKRIQSTTFRH